MSYNYYANHDYKGHYCRNPFENLLHKMIFQLSEEDFQILYKAVRNDSHEFKGANYSLRLAMVHCKEDREEKIMKQEEFYMN